MHHAECQVNHTDYRFKIPFRALSDPATTAKTPSPSTTMAFEPRGVPPAPAFFKRPPSPDCIVRARIASAHESPDPKVLLDQILAATPQSGALACEPSTKRPARPSASTDLNFDFIFGGFGVDTATLSCLPAVSEQPPARFPAQTGSSKKRRRVAAVDTDDAVTAFLSAGSAQWNVMAPAGAKLSDTAAARAANVLGLSGSSPLAASLDTLGSISPASTAPPSSSLSAPACDRDR